MNQKTWVIAGVIVLALIGLTVFYTSQNKVMPAGTTTTIQTTTTTTQTKQASSPTVVTSQSVAPSDTTAVVTGTVIPNGSFTNYTFEYGIASDLSNSVSIQNQTIGSGFARIPAPGYITGLTKDTTYYFRLVAQNQFGKVVGAKYAFQTTHGNPPPVGSAPTTKTLVASGISKNTANLNGEITPNNASTEYWFEYGENQNLGNATSLQSAGSNTTKIPVSVSVSDLLPYTTYYFRLNSQNQFGTVNGAILDFKTAGPPSSVAPSVTTKASSNITTSSATLRGVVNPNGAVTTYWFEYSSDSLLGSLLLNTTDKKSAGAGSKEMAINEDISGLSSKTNYYFRLVAQNDLGTTRGEKISFKTR